MAAVGRTGDHHGIHELAFERIQEEFDPFGPTSDSSDGSRSADEDGVGAEGVLAHLQERWAAHREAWLEGLGDAIPREQLEAFAELMHHPDRITDFCESDDEFHELLMSTLPNKYLRSAYDRITGLNTRFRIMTGKVSMINQEQTCEEHLEILNAALSDNWNTAADALQHHLELARDKAEGVIKVIRLW